MQDLLIHSKQTYIEYFSGAINEETVNSRLLNIYEGVLFLGSTSSRFYNIGFYTIILSGLNNKPKPIDKSTKVHAYL